MSTDLVQVRKKMRPDPSSTLTLASNLTTNTDDSAFSSACYLNLPLELKHMILADVFAGAMIVFGVAVRTHPQVSIDWKVIAITSHRSILMAKKQCWNECWNECVQLYYQKAELTLQGDRYFWPWYRMLQQIPACYLENIRILTPIYFAPTQWLGPYKNLKLRDRLPALLELHLPTVKATVGTPPFQDKVRATIRKEWDRCFKYYGRDGYEANLAAFNGVKVFQEVSLKISWRIIATNPVSGGALKAEMRVIADFDFETEEIVETVPEVGEGTTFLNL